MVSARRRPGLWEVTTGSPDWGWVRGTTALRAGLAEGGWRCPAQTWFLGAGVGGRSIFPGKQTLENWMIPCISSQPYDLITRKCHMHLFCTDRCVERKAGRFNIFSSGLWVSLIFLEGEASLWPCSHKAGLFARRSLAATQRRMTLSVSQKKSGGSQAGGWR